MRDLGMFYEGAHRRTPEPTSARSRLARLRAGQHHFEARHLARRKGGTDHPDNLQLLCGNCNRIKGQRGMEYLRVKLQLA